MTGQLRAKATWYNVNWVQRQLGTTKTRYNGKWVKTTGYNYKSVQRQHETRQFGTTTTGYNGNWVQRQLRKATTRYGNNLLQW